MTVSTPLNEILVEMDIETRTPVFRDGEFIPITVSPASTYRCTCGWATGTHSKGLFASTSRPASIRCWRRFTRMMLRSTGQGGSAPWSTASAARFNDQFNAALRALPGSRNGADLAGLRSMPDLRVVLDAEAGRFLSEQEVLQIWRRELAGIGLVQNSLPETVLRHSIVAAAQNVRGRTRSPLHGHSRGFPARCRVSVQRASCALGCPAHVVSVARVLHCGKRADEARTPGRRARAGARRQLATFSAAEGLALRSSMKSRPSAILRTAALAAAITLAVFQPPVLATGEQGPPAFPHDSQLLEKLHDRRFNEIGSASEDRLSLAAVVQGFNHYGCTLRGAKFEILSLPRYMHYWSDPQDRLMLGFVKLHPLWLGTAQATSARGGCESKWAQTTMRQPDCAAGRAHSARGRAAALFAAEICRPATGPFGSAVHEILPALLRSGVHARLHPAIARAR